MRGRWYILLPGAVCAVGLVVWALLMLRQPESAESVVRKALPKVIKGEAGWVFDHLSDDEKSRLSLTEDKVDAYLASFVRPMLDGFEARGEPEINAQAHDGTVTLSQLFTNADGRAFHLTLQASPAGRQDARLNAFIADTYMTLCYSTMEPGQAPPTGKEKRKKWVADAKKYGKQLDSIGITGFFSASRSLYTWASWIEHNETVLARQR